MITPTNAKGGWSFDTDIMNCVGRSGTMFRGMLAYGITEDLQASLSIPYVFSSAPFAPARITGMMPASGAVEAIGAGRFHRQGTCIGTADVARRETQRLTEHQVSCSDTGESAYDLSA